MNLAELIRTTKGDRTYDQLSHDCGREPTSQRLQQMAAGKPVREFPKVSTIRNLAVGLGVSQQTVILAVAESAGLDVRPVSGIAALIPPSDVELSDREVATILQVVRTVLDGARLRQTTPKLVIPQSPVVVKGGGSERPREGSGRQPRRSRPTRSLDERTES